METETGNDQKKKKSNKLKCNEIVEEKISDGFNVLGQFIARHPIKIIIAVLLVNGLLGIGMLEMEQDIDVSRVYTPMNSQASQDEQKILQIFPDNVGADFYRYQLVNQPQYASLLLKPNSGNILDVDFLSAVNITIYAVKNIVSKLNGETLQYEYVCAKNRGRCVIDGNVFSSQFFKSSAGAGNVTFPIFITPDGQELDLEPLIGHVKVNGNILIKAEYLKLQFNIRSDDQTLKEKAHAWQDKFIDVMKVYSSDKFTFAFAHTESLGQELNANIGGDIALFSVTFILMITFACFVTYPATNNCIGNRFIMGMLGVVAAGLGIIASFGLVSACGMSFVSIVGNCPFLILGIGVDDMFILMSGLTLAGFTGSTRSRIGGMMKVSGVAITITSLTNVLAFASGASSTFKSVRNFCVYTGVAVIFCYINQTFFFTACLTINERRIERSKHAFLCCKTVHNSNYYKDKGNSKVTIFCCAGQKPTSKDDIESYLEKFPRGLLPKLTSSTPAKIIILLGFGVYLGTSIWGVLNLEQGLIINNLVSEDSYYNKYLKWEDEYFPTRIPVSFVIQEPVSYSSTIIQGNIEALLTRISQNKYMTTKNIVWLDQYKNSSYYDQSNKSSFISGLYSFLSDVQFERYKNDVKISQNNATIAASRFYVFTSNIKNSQDSGSMMLQLRDIASDAIDLSVIAFAPSFIFYEQYIAILPQTLQTLGVSVAAVFLVTIIFMPHPLMLLYILIAVCSILVGIVGFMHFWGLTLSSVTMIHLIMSVGFSIDYTAHICHAFIVASGKNKNERAVNALKSSGTPIFNGAVSSVIGILMLAFAKSYIFNSFFKVMLLVILFGICHSVLLLPVILSLIGPSKTIKVSQSDKISNGRPFTFDKRSMENPVHRLIFDLLNANPGVSVMYNGSSVRVLNHTYILSSPRYVTR